MFPAFGSYEFLCVLEAVGMPLFVVPVLLTNTGAVWLPSTGKP